jgi:hypothetical protein
MLFPFFSIKESEPGISCELILIEKTSSQFYVSLLDSPMVQFPDEGGKWKSSTMPITPFSFHVSFLKPLSYSIFHPNTLLKRFNRK